MATLLAIALLSVVSQAERAPPVPPVLFPNADGENLRVFLGCDASSWRTALPSATFVDVAQDLDIAVGCASDDLSLLDHLLPGGVLVLPADSSTTFGKTWDALAYSVAFMSPYDAKSGVRRDIRALWRGEDGTLVLMKKGVLDDNDHMALGDYGKMYGEYDWGLFARAVQRQVEVPWVFREKFAKQLQIFQVPLGKVQVLLKLQHRYRAGVFIFKTREGKIVKMDNETLLSGLRSDMAFALQIHRERISIQVRDGNGFIAEIAPWRRVFHADKVPDYRLHEKVQNPWSTWKSYFGDAQPQSQAVVAQTAREKMLMVDDDLSDFYQGKVTVAVPELGVQVAVVSSACSEFADVLLVHKFRCIQGGPEDSEVAGRHSILYSLTAKEKLDGSIGVGSEASLASMYSRTSAKFPKMARVTLTEEQEDGPSSFGFYDDKDLKSGEAKALLPKLPLGVDVVLDHRGRGMCKNLDHLPRQVLVPGAIWLLEGLAACRPPKKWSHFVASLARTSNATILLGRSVVAANTLGKWAPSAGRAKWPQKADATEL